MKVNTSILSKIMIFAITAIAISCNDNSIEPSVRNTFIEKIEIQKDKKLMTLISRLYNHSSSLSGRTLASDFGSIGLDTAIKLNDTINDRTRYTLKLESKLDQLTFENLVIVERKEGVFHYILQYKPDLKWYYENQSVDWTKYTGIIRQLDVNRTLVVESRLVNGKNLEDRGGRVDGCNSCTWKINKANFSSFLDINCGSGGSFTLWLKNTRVGGCGGGGDGGSTGVGNSPPGGSTGGSAPAGGADSSGPSGGGGSNSSNDTNQSGEYSNPIAIYPVVKGGWIGRELGYPNNWWSDNLWLDENLTLDPYDKYKKLTAAERALVKQDPLAAIIINSNREKAFKAVEIYFANEMALNDRADAFRHAYFNALNKRDLGRDPLTYESIAKLFGDAHESEVPAQLILEKQMDLWNNQVGQQIGNNALFPIFTSDENIANQVLNKLYGGELRYLSPIWFKDPNFWGNNGSRDESTATHGSRPNTMLMPTNY